MFSSLNTEDPLIGLTISYFIVITPYLLFKSFIFLRTLFFNKYKMIDNMYKFACTSDDFIDNFLFLKIYPTHITILSQSYYGSNVILLYRRDKSQTFNTLSFKEFKEKISYLNKQKCTFYYQYGISKGLTDIFSNNGKSILNELNTILNDNNFYTKDQILKLRQEHTSNLDIR